MIVAMTIGFGDAPNLTIVPGPEFPTEEACVRATHAHGNFDSDHVERSRVAFSFCVPKGSVQIGGQAPADAKKEAN